MTKITALALLMLISCNREALKKYVPSKADTVQTAAKWFWEQDIAAHETKIWRVTKDTVAYDTIPSTVAGAQTLRPKYHRDTMYIIQVNVPVKDSLGKVLKDSAGNPKLRQALQMIDKKYVIEDYDKHF